MSIARIPLDVVRGLIIGSVEVVPGVSGGTLALVLGVYDTLIGSMSSFVRGAVALVTDLPRGRGAHRGVLLFRAVRWGVVLPILVGMAIAVVAGAAIIAPLIESNPVETRAVFTGLIAASLFVPIRMIGRAWRWHHVLLAALTAIAAFFLTGLPAGTQSDPQLPFVALAAALAICALVLPGVSGSFILLAIGLYEPTLAAVNDRDFLYLATFAVGAIIGLGLFVNVLRWLLERHRSVTLAVMTGLMLGSLRALWPWQDEEGSLMAPSGDVGFAVLLILMAAAVVFALLAVEYRLNARAVAREHHSAPTDASR